MRRGLLIAFAVLLSVAAIAADGGSARTAAGPVRVQPFGFHSRLLGRDFREILLLPAGPSRGRQLLVFLHGYTQPTAESAAWMRPALRALAEAGADVALGLRDISRDGGLADEIRALGRRALPLQMDVTNLDQVEAAVTATVEELGSVDLLVNNAGGGAGLMPAEDVSVAAFEHTVDANLKGTFFTCRAAFAPMRERGFGRIVNLSSQAALVALPGEAVYCMTKAAVSHLTRCLAVEWGEHGIAVNAVAPTFIRTPGTEPALSNPWLAFARRPRSG